MEAFIWLVLTWQLLASGYFLDLPLSGKWRYIIAWHLVTAVGTETGYGTQSSSDW